MVALNLEPFRIQSGALCLPGLNLFHTPHHSGEIQPIHPFLPSILSTPESSRSKAQACKGSEIGAGLQRCWTWRRDNKTPIIHC